jgi:two-component system phosphate regulon response regulator PhoB
MRIVILEHDVVERDALCQLAVRSGYSCAPYADFCECVRALASQVADAVIVDWLLPDVPGDEAVRSIRSRIGPHVPIMVLTTAAQEDDVFASFPSGIDGYMVKPLRSAELMARICALVRRSQMTATGHDVIRLANYVVDVRQREVTVGHRRLRLGRRDFDVVTLFFRNFERLVSHHEIAAAVWGAQMPRSSNLIDRYVAVLQRRLDLISENGLRLRCLSGQGYKLELVSETSSTDVLGPVGSPRSVS